MQEGLGGAKRLAAIRDLDETIRAQAWDERGGSLGEVRKRTRWIRSPSTLRLDQKGPRGTYVLYLDGDSNSGWEILPDLTGPDRFKTTGTPIALTGGELEFARHYLSGFELNLWLADERGYTVTSPRSDVLRIEKDGNATDITLDPVTRLPVKTAGVSLADPDRPVPAEMRYGGWSEISGVRFPRQRANYHSGVKRGEVITEALHCNVGLRREEVAAKPADFAPELGVALVLSMSATQSRQSSLFAFTTDDFWLNLHHYLYVLGRARRGAPDATRASILSAPDDEKQGRERLDKPVIVSHGFPGSFVATLIAADYPDAIGGAVEIAAMPVQATPSPADPTGKTLVPPEERAMYVDMLWAPKWFKYVTAETWESNNYRAAMFENDRDRAEQARRRIEQTPLAVKARYLMESNATDDSADFAPITIPLLAVRPGFSEAILSDPANAWFTTSFVGAWTAFVRNANIRLATIPAACVRVFHDQPDAADEVVASFVERLGDPGRR